MQPLQPCRPITSVTRSRCCRRATSDPAWQSRSSSTRIATTRIRDLMGAVQCQPHVLGMRRDGVRDARVARPRISDTSARDAVGRKRSALPSRAATSSITPRASSGSRQSPWHARFEDAGFFVRDAGERVAEMPLVIERNGSDAPSRPGVITLVASKRPPRPTSITATSTRRGERSQTPSPSSLRRRSASVGASRRREPIDGARRERSTSLKCCARPARHRVRRVLRCRSRCGDV